MKNKEGITGQKSKAFVLWAQALRPLESMIVVLYVLIPYIKSIPEGIHHFYR